MVLKVFQEAQNWFLNLIQFSSLIGKSIHCLGNVVHVNFTSTQLGKKLFHSISADKVDNQLIVYVDDVFSGPD